MTRGLTKLRGRLAWRVLRRVARQVAAEVRAHKGHRGPRWAFFRGERNVKQRSATERVSLSRTRVGGQSASHFAQDFRVQRGRSTSTSQELQGVVFGDVTPQEPADVQSRQIGAEKSGCQPHRPLQSAGATLHRQSSATSASQRPNPTLAGGRGQSGGSALGWAGLGAGRTSAAAAGRTSTRLDSVRSRQPRRLGSPGAAGAAHRRRRRSPRY